MNSLWDVGAGAGSIAIEWVRSGYECRAIAVEHNLDRVKRIRGNAEALGVPGLEVLHGEAPGALASLPQPDAVFVGGGGTSETIEQAWSALRPGGRLGRSCGDSGDRDDRDRVAGSALAGADSTLGGTSGADRPVSRLASGASRRAMERDQGSDVTVHFIGAGPGAGIC